MNIKRNVNFFLESRKKDGVKVVTNVPIRMRVKFSGERIEFSTGYRIDDDKWDSSKQKVKTGCANKQKQSASQINADLADCYAKIQSIFQEFEYKNLIPTVEQVKQLFQQKTEKKASKKSNIISSKNTTVESKSKNAKLSFWQVHDLFVRECGRLNDWTEATYGKFSAARNHMKNFDPNMTFESLNENRLNDFVIYLRNVKNLRNSTIANQLDFLKWYLKWAHHKGYNSNRIFEIFKPKLKYARKIVVFLCEDELVALKELKIPEYKQYLERVRDVFLFCCYTGLRYSDVYNLKRCDIKDDYFEIVTIKSAPVKAA